MELTKRAALSGLLAAAAAAATPALAQAPASPLADVEAKARAQVAAKATPGLQLCVWRGGAAVLSRGFGLANLETRTPMTPASICRIGSVTKQFTAAAILQLAAEGKLSLDDTMAKFLPDFPNAERLVLRRVLSHTSGLGNYTAVDPKVFLQQSRIDRDTAALIEAMKASAQPLAYEPGTDWRYSNTGYVLLGVVIEKVTGKPYAAAMRERLFEPLKLTRTSVDDAAEVVPGRASGYSNDAAAASGFDNASFIAMSWPGGAGSIRSTCEDLCAWQTALLGGKVLRPDMLKAMMTPAVLNDGQLPTQADGKGGRTPIYYGFGVQFGAFQNHKLVTHSGGIQGFASILESFYDDGLTWAMMVNTDRWPPPAQAGIITAVRAALVAAK
jgi:CubicO group peptidase (beta-lactamase class C family)